MSRLLCKSGLFVRQIGSKAAKGVLRSADELHPMQISRHLPNLAYSRKESEVPSALLEIS